jgi:hypothetical protein
MSNDAIFDSELAEAINEAYAEAASLQSSIERARADGREITSVMCKIDVKKGDIIKMSRCDEEGEPQLNGETAQARVLAVHPLMTYDPETGKAVYFAEALVIILNPEDVETIDDFAAMYGDGSDEDSEVEETTTEEEDPPEETAPQVVESTPEGRCPECGADFDSCAMHQEVFGVHVNE